MNQRPKYIAGKPDVVVSADDAATKSPAHLYSPHVNLRIRRQVVPLLALGDILVPPRQDLVLHLNLLQHLSCIT